MINNRQAGRRRGRGGNNNGGQGQGRQQGNGSRIDSRARGNATQLHEKYKNMAADAQRAGDRVNTEYYLQFADHYFRVLSEQRGRFEDQQPRPRRDEFDMDGSGEDGDEFGDEGEPMRARDGWNEGEQPRYANRDDRPRDDRPRDDRPRDDRPRDDRPREGGEREERARDDRPRDDRPREFRRDEQDGRRNGNANASANGDGRQQGRSEWQDRDRQDRGDRPDRPRQDRGERRPAVAPTEIRADVGGQHRADAIAPGESLDGRADEVLNADRPLDAPAPRRRGRPRRDETPVAEEALGFALPPSIASVPAIAANDEEPAKPRRRRTRPADETPTAAE